MLLFCATLLISIALGGSTKINIVSLNGLSFIQDGGDISLNCSFSSPEESNTAWFKQTPGEKPLLIASAYHSKSAVYHNGFDKSGRFIALRQKNSLTLNISNAEPSDSATYYCSVAYYTQNALSDWTIVVLKGGSGESDPGIIYTHGNRSDQCKKSSETASPTQSCVYKLPKNNLSLSDAGTYYCAVAACDEIISGNGAQVEFVENELWVTIITVLAASNIISMIVGLFLCRKLHAVHHKDAGEGQVLPANQDVCDEDLNYAALSFINKPPTSRGARRQKKLKDTEVYAQVKFPR